MKIKKKQHFFEPYIKSNKYSRKMNMLSAYLMFVKLITSVSAE